MSKSTDIRKFFPDDQGWELFRAACSMADKASARVATLEGQVTKARILKAETGAQAAIAQLITKGAVSGRPDPRIKTADFFHPREAK